MNRVEAAKLGQPSEPGEYDAGMLTLLQIIWGDGFLSPGGGEELSRLLEGSDISDCRVLDIGCGLGAVDELLVAQYGARSVVGIDIDPALLAGMRQRIERAGLADRIRSMGARCPSRRRVSMSYFRRTPWCRFRISPGSLPKSCACCGPGDDSSQAIGYAEEVPPIRPK
jgi:SAM-dependent methyltransferase